MAEKTAKPKRQVKNPETFRERAIKASEASDKPRRGGQIVTFAGKTSRRVTSPIAKPFQKLYRQPFMRPARFIFRWLGKLLFVSYFVQSGRELKLVTWPGWKESRRLTYAVLVFAVVFGASIAGVDYGLDKLFKNLLLK